MSTWITDPMRDALLTSHNIASLFPLQERCVAHILQTATSNLAADVCIASPTGSGKTLCYVLPIVHYLASHMASTVQCVVLLPTKDTAQEVYNVFRSVLGHTHLHAALLCGSLSLEGEQQMLQKRVPGNADGLVLCCAHIVIGTPRRVLDHVDTFPDLFRAVRFLAIDEADVLLAPSNSDWVYKLLDVMNRPSGCVMHKILCSATLTSSLPLYVHLGMSNVATFQNASGEGGREDEPSDAFTLPETLLEYTIDVEEDEKLRTLLCILEESRIREKADDAVVLIFCSSVVRTHRIHRFLSIVGYASCEFSRNLSHRQRMSNMNSLFMHSKSNVVVATDVLGRGIDFSQKITVVIQYDAPVDAKTYLHRCGRTARAMRHGTAITLTDPACADFMTHLRAQLLPAKALVEKEYDVDTIPVSKMTQALAALQRVLAMEDQRTLQPTDAVPATSIVDFFKKSAIAGAATDRSSVAPTAKEKITFHWVCAICKYTNLPRNATQCFRCTTPRTGAEKKYTGPMDKAVHGGMWKCKGCGARGLPRDLACGKCNKKRSSADSIMFFGPAVLKRPNEEEGAV